MCAVRLHSSHPHTPFSSLAPLSHPLRPSTVSCDAVPTCLRQCVVWRWFPLLSARKISGFFDGDENSYSENQSVMLRFLPLS